MFKNVYLSRELEDEREKAKYPNWDTTYFKGIGECDAIDMKLTMFSPENRRVIVYKAEDFQSFSSLLELLMGNDVPLRREYIFNNLDFKKLREEE